MIPLRVGDSIRVEGDTMFAGAVGQVETVYSESGTYMVRLDRWHEDGPPVRIAPIILPFAASELQPTSCQHLLVTEEELRRYINNRWDWNVTTPVCPDCHEWLYPEDQDDGSIRIYVGEPKGAGDDYWGRPDPHTHPEAWTE